MLHEIIVPELAESTVEATVASWLKKEGEIITKGDVIIELDTDKVSLEIVAPSDGTIQSITKQEGETVKVGDILGTINDSKTVSNNENNDNTAGSAETKVGKPQDRNTNTSGVNITPVAKKIAEKENIDLDNIKGTGPNGKITKEDLISPEKETVQKLEPNNINKEKDINDREESIKLSRRRITIAKRLKEVQSETVMTTTYNEVVITVSLCTSLSLLAIVILLLDSFIDSSLSLISFSLLILLGSSF
jgi:2-oxoglutarate dehydrogenase E2 component (dihydrolipoamide succinyltransferase)